MYQLYVIEEFLQERVKNMIFVKLESRYADIIFSLFWKSFEITEIYLWNE